MARGRLISSACSHIFHKGCFERLTSPNCPYCRSPTADVKEKDRTSRKKYANGDRERIMHAGDNWAAVAKVLGVPYKTAYNWIVSGREIFKVPVHNQEKVLSEEQIDKVLEEVERDPCSTLAQLQDFVSRQFATSLSISTIANYLQMRSYSCKSLHRQPGNTNSAENKIKRKAYGENLLQYIAEGTLNMIKY